MIIRGYLPHTSLSHHQKRNYPTDSRHRIDVIRSDTKDSLRANQSAAAEIQPIDGSERSEP
jgi:hypothetical protein